MANRSITLFMCKGECVRHYLDNCKGCSISNICANLFKTPPVNISDDVISKDCKAFYKMWKGEKNND